MAEWLLLVLLVPAIVAPVVLLFGFAGCGFTGRAVALPVPIINSANGKSRSVIALNWIIDVAASEIEFERRLVTPMGPMGPPVTFRKTGSPNTQDDDENLESGTTYEYKARAVFGGGDTSEQSAPVRGATLAGVTFDSAGAGGTGSGAGSATTTWPHTVSAESNTVVVGMRWAQSVGLLPLNETPTRTATFGGTVMTSLGVLGLNNAALTATALNGTFVYQEFFGLRDPPTGAQTVSVSVNRQGAGSVSLTGCSVTYKAVSGIGAVTSVFGTEAGTVLAQPVSSATDEMVVQMFSTATGTISGYNQTVRFDGAPNGIGLVIGDAAGAPSVPFTAVRATGVDYAGLSVRLIPGP